MPDIKLPLEDEHLPLLKKEFQRQFELARSAWQCASMLILPGDKVGIGKGEFLSLCLSASYVKLMRQFYTIYRLCEGGLADESNLQLRAMFELYVKLRFLAIKVEDKNEFARRWGIWGMANNKKFIDAVEKFFPGEPDNRFADWKIKIEEEAGKVSKDEWRRFLKDGPWKCNFADLCEQVGHGQNYPMYSLLSGTVHGYDLFSYARKIGEEVTEMDMAPTRRGIDQNIAAAVSLLHDSMNVINVELGLGKDKPVEDIGKLARALWTIPK